MSAAEDCSTWAEDEDQLSREKLQMIKARTEMVVAARPQAALPHECDLLASSDDSLQKMLDALEVPKPQLVISL